MQLTYLAQLLLTHFVNEACHSIPSYTIQALHAFKLKLELMFADFNWDNIQLISDEEKAECQRQIANGGVECCLNYLKQKEGEWKTVPLNIGVIGNSGVGKSSFINAIRRLNADDEGAAAVGVTETTTDIQAYSHPNNPLLQFWDLPGVGTPNFPKDEYLNRIGFDKFHFFLLLSAARFTENDAWLGQEITTKNKKFYYVRTKIDDDMRSSRQAHPRTHDEVKEVEKIRTSTSKLLKDDTTPVFLIDNYKPQKYDFCKLEESLVVNFPKLKRSALILPESAFSSEVIKLKVKELRSRMWKMSMMSVGVATVPLPGLSYAFDMSLVLHEANFYKTQLGLDQQSLQQLAAYTSTNVKSLLQVTAKLPLSVEGLKVLAHAIPQVVAATVLEEVTRFIPLIGSFIAAPLSFGATYYLLHTILNQFEEAALEVIRVAISHSSYEADEDDDDDD